MKHVINGLQLFQKIIARNSRYRQILHMLLAIFTVSMFFLWIHKTIRIVYAANDDIAFQELANGSISGVPDGHLVYIKYVLGWTISQLYIVDKHLDWYGLTMLGLLYTSLLLILFRALETTRTLKRSLVVIFFVLVGFTLFGLRQIAEIQYTTVAGLLAATGVFWLATSEFQTRLGGIANLLTCALLMLTSYIVRSNVFFMSIPFAGLVFLYQYLVWRHRQIDQLILPVALLIGIGVVSLIELSAYRDPAWQAYLTFNLSGRKSTITVLCLNTQRIKRFINQSE